MTLACASGGTFEHVVFASFGTPTGTCGSFKKGTCDASNTTAWVESLCVGKSSCTIPEDPTVRNTNSPLVQALGDPCHNIEKQLAVQLFGCKPTPPAPPTPPPTLPVRLSGKGDSIMFDWGQETGAMLIKCVSSAAVIILLFSLRWIYRAFLRGGIGQCTVYFACLL